LEAIVDDARPIFIQIAEQLASQIVDGSMPEEAQVPSINELAAFHRINPATALKGVTLLVDAGILYKRRGVGMFVSLGARDRLLADRKDAFRDDFVRPLVAQAKALGITGAQLTQMIGKEAGL